MWPVSWLTMRASAHPKLWNRLIENGPPMYAHDARPSVNDCLAGAGL